MRDNLGSYDMLLYSENDMVGAAVEESHLQPIFVTPLYLSTSLLLLLLGGHGHGGQPGINHGRFYG